MFRSILAGLAVAALPVALATTAHAALDIDRFEAEQILVLGLGGADAAFSSVAAPEALGGERDASIQRIAGNEPADLLVNPTGNDRLLSCSAGPSSSVEWVIVWDGADGVATVDETGLGGIDLTQGGANTGFLVRVLTDVAASLQIELTDMVGGSTSGELVLPGGDAGLVSRFLPFSEFDEPGIAANVGSVSLTLSGEAGLDAQMDFVRVTAPEPAGAGVVAACALLVLARRRGRVEAPRG
jgi:hypothetical protein